MIIDSPIVSGSYAASGSFNQFGDVVISGSLTVTGSIIGTASLATTASFAATASYAANVPITASYALSASQATTASYLSGYVSPFPFTGSAIISGSLGITGSLSVTNFSGSGVRYLVTDASGSVTAQTASAVIKTTQAFTATGGQTTFAVTNGYSTGYVDVFVNGTKLNSTEFTDTSGTNIVLTTGSFVDDVVEVVKYLPASGVSNNVLRQLTTFTAAASQSVFNIDYTPGLLDIFYNGSRLSPSEYTANNGTSFTLATASAADDILDVMVYSYQVGAFSGIGGQGVTNQIAFFNTTSSISGSNNFTISGSTMTVTGSLLVTGSGTFTNIGPAVLSGSVSVSGSIALNGSNVVLANQTSSLSVSTASFAATASSADNFLTRGTLTAQTIVVQTITSSVEYVTGSTIWGSRNSDTHLITGSLAISGSSTTALDVNAGILFVSSSGRVGIGTTSLVHRLNISGITRISNSGSTSQLQIFSPSGFGSFIYWAEDTVADRGILGYASGSGDLVYRSGADTLTTGTERFRITSGGNVLIGTTTSFSSPLVTNIGAGAAGSLNNQIAMTHTGASTAYYIKTIRALASDEPDGLAFVQNATERMRITSGGNVVVNTSGTSAPNAGQLVNKQRSDTTTPYLNGIVNMASGSSKYLQFYYDGALNAQIIGASYYTSGDGGAYTPMTFFTSDIERIRITSGGQVGIGTSSPSALLHVSSSTAASTVFRVDTANSNGTLFVSSSGNVGIGTTNPTAGLEVITAGNTTNAVRVTTSQAYNASPLPTTSVVFRYKYNAAGDYTSGAIVEGFKENTTDGNQSGSLVFWTNGGNAVAEKMRITSAGEMYWNLTGTAASNLNAGGILFRNNIGKYIQISTGKTTDEALIYFYKSDGAGGVTNTGNISTSGSSTSYNTTSDYRIKEDFKEINGLEKVSALKIYDFKWKNSEDRMVGVLAHELQEILPYAVTGQKDEIDEYGKDKLQGADYSKIVPVLIKAIQEQQTQIEQLQSQINELKNK